jgi:carbonic anhydrase
MSESPLQSRRALIRTAAAAGLLTACGERGQHTPTQEAPIITNLTLPPLTMERRDQLTPDTFLEFAKEGNKRFREGAMITRDYRSEQQATAAGQYPGGVVLGCIDSRAPAEILFNFGIGDLFNARVAGNVVNPDILGSMEFATALAGAMLVVVMGHTKCGAVKGAIAGAKMGNLTGLLAKLQPAIAATTFDGEKSADNYAYVDAVARKNAEITVQNVRAQSKVMADLEQEGKLKIVGAMYDIGSGAVEFLS